jgi:hypothetical protein
MKHIIAAPPGIGASRPEAFYSDYHTRYANDFPGDGSYELAQQIYQGNLPSELYLSRNIMHMFWTASREEIKNIGHVLFTAKGKADHHAGRLMVAHNRGSHLDFEPDDNGYPSHKPFDLTIGRIVSARVSEIPTNTKVTSLMPIEFRSTPRKVKPDGSVELPKLIMKTGIAIEDGLTIRRDEQGVITVKPEADNKQLVIFEGIMPIVEDHEVADRGALFVEHDMQFGNVGSLAVMRMLAADIGGPTEYRANSLPTVYSHDFEPQSYMYQLTDVLLQA